MIEDCIAFAQALMAREKMVPYFCASPKVRKERKATSNENDSKRPKLMFLNDRSHPAKFQNFPERFFMMRGSPDKVA